MVEILNYMICNVLKDQVKGRRSIGRVRKNLFRDVCSLSLEAPLKRAR